MARKPTPVVIEPSPEVPLDQLAANVRAVEIMDAEIASNTQALATQLNYDGSLNPDALETGIRDSQARVSMELFHVGARLLLLKEQCAHGEFMERLERLQINYRLAARFMQATLKFSNVSTSTHLQKLGMGKLTEMLILDDDEIKELSEEGSVRGIELDDIDRMSVRELRKQLRDAKAQAQGTQKLLAEKNERIDALHTELNKDKLSKPALVTPAMELQSLLGEVSSLTSSITATLCAEFNRLFTRIFDHHEQHGDSSRQILAGHLEQIGGEIDELRGMFALMLGGGRDEWDTDEWEPEAVTLEGDSHLQADLLHEQAGEE